LACTAISLVAIPVYMLVTMASFALSSVTDVAKIVPLITSSALGRALVDMEVIVALFAAAGAIAIAIDHSRGQRSVAALLAQTGAMLAGGAMLAVPGLAGHAAQTSPAGLAWPLDWLHMVTASLWLGGLAGLLVLVATAGTARRASLARVVP